MKMAKIKVNLKFAAIILYFKNVAQGYAFLHYWLKGY